MHHIERKWRITRPVNVDLIHWICSHARGLHIHWQELTRTTRYHSNSSMQAAQMMCTPMQQTIRMHTGRSGWKHVWVMMRAKVRQSRTTGLRQSAVKHLPLSQMDVEEEYIENANLFSPGKHYQVVLNSTCGIMCNPIKLNTQTHLYSIQPAHSRAQTHRYSKQMAKANKAIWICISDKT